MSVKYLIFLGLRIIIITSLLSGCAHYVTPGGSVSLAEISDLQINDVLSQKPQANFPAIISIARVQASGYRNYQLSSYGEGRYSVVTTREIENKKDYEFINHLKGVKAVAPINRLFLPTKLEDIKSLRIAAARLKSDMLLVYTFDTTYHVGEQSFAPLNVISLGFLKNKDVSVTTTATAAFFDVRTEFLYGLAESTERQTDTTSIWSSESVVDDLRVSTEKIAFKKLLSEIENTWLAIIEQHDSNL